jgi:hypothetical protein
MKKSGWKQIAVFLLLFSLFGAGGFFVGKLLKASFVHISTDVIIASAILLIPIIMFAIAFHEAGHAIVGSLMKFDFKMYVVGPFMWAKENNKWRFKWNTNVNTMGGMVICLPVRTDKLQKRFSLYVAGGPLASLLLTAVAITGYYSLPASDLLSEVLAATLLFTSFISGSIFLVTIIPLHTGGFASDGARILRFMRGGEVARLEILTLKVITDSTSGIRPKDLNKDELEEVLHLAQKSKSPFTVYLHAFMYQVAWDSGDIDKAEEYLLNYINEVESIPEGLRGMAWMEAAFFYSLEKKDAAKAEEYWSRFAPSAMIPKAQVYATEAALYRAQGKSEKVRELVDKAEKELPNMLDQGLAVALREKLEGLRKQQEGLNPSTI